MTTSSPARQRVASASRSARPAGVPAGTTGRPGPRLHRAVFLLAVLGVAVATAALRLYHQATSYELFVDEIQYADVANAIASGHTPTLFGDPFYLHPPLLFGYLTALQGPPVPYLTAQFVLGLRPFIVVFAVLNSIFVVAIARRLTSRRCALVAGALYALDPFIVRFDSRVMLEAPTLTATLGGLAAAMVAMECRGRGRTALLVLAGLAFGVAVTTKSTSALVTTVPLVLMVLFRVGPRRREAIGMIAVQCGVYGCYVAWTAATGHLGDWFGQTLSGALRAAARPETGFNSVTAPSLPRRIVAQLAQFGPSYLLIAVAVGTIAVLVFEEIRSRGRAGQHRSPVVDALTPMLTCWLGGIVLAIGYTGAFGELEEQTFYLMAVPSTIVIAVLVARTNASTHKVVRAGALATVLAVLVWSGQVWVTVHTRPDDAYARLESYLSPLVGSGQVIALGERTAQFVTPGFRLVPIDGPTLPAGARFAVVSTELSRLDLGLVTTDGIAALDRRYPVAFVATGRTVGELRLYDLSRPRRPGS